MGNSSLLFLKFFEGFVDAGLAELIDGQILNHMVFPALASDWEAEHRVLDRKSVV